MDAFYRPTYVEISLDALRSNLETFRRVLPGSVHMMAVLKADAYGHGAVEVSKVAMECGATYLAVAFLDEAMELRNAGITAPILVLGYTPPEGIGLALEHDITLTVYTEELLEAASGYAQRDAAAGGNKPPLNIHIKIDSGMGRIGLHDEDEAVAFIAKALQTQGIRVEGLFTHYANADETDKAYTYEQHAKFAGIVRKAGELPGARFPFVHAGNSATAIDLPELTYNMVRLGIAMYGLYPSEEVNKEQIRLKPVLSLKTGIVHLKTLPPRSGVSYGTIYHTQGDEQIATLPIGYADGFSRLLTGKAEALVRGRRAPVVGRICMDQCMLNTSDIPEAAFGDEVVLLGEQGEERITAEEIAAKLGTINYEVTCMISHRVPRVYVSGGRRVKAVNSLFRHLF
ncbi:alanine racemase [Paenibacillus chitinolyticus]|uniref:alanine racemase n=1 Tax=Paenibacillus chitinolyticus TaxID=79263 RepID=UPI0038705203